MAKGGYMTKPNISRTYELLRKLPHLDMKPGSRLVTLMSAGGDPHHGPKKHFFPLIMVKNPGTGMGLEGADIGPFWKPDEPHDAVFEDRETAHTVAQQWALDLNLTYVETI